MIGNDLRSYLLGSFEIRLNKDAKNILGGLFDLILQFLQVAVLVIAKYVIVSKVEESREE